jgi:phage terminase large subunit-like protein
MRALHGSRYLTGRNKELQNIIQNELPYYDFEETVEFYDWFNAQQPAPEDIALLNANDRYYLLVCTLGRPDALHPWLFDRCREVEENPDGFLDLWARYHYKDISQETAVLTTNGWKQHGELKPGDWVFSPSGKPVKVVATKHFTDSACRRVTLDNNIQIVAGAGHLWKVSIPSRARMPDGKRQGRRSVILETDQIAALNTAFRPLIEATAPIDVPDADLPVHPYVLGAWLGDGYSDSASICGVDAEIFDNIIASGYELRPARKAKTSRHPDYRIHTVKKLSVGLRALGVLRNKHIPMRYLTASMSQRLALLQGLIDTDGSTSAANGCVTFSQTDRAMAEDVQTLANSLGFKARLTPNRSTSSWHVTFQASRDQMPCRLTRKLNNLKERVRRPGSQGWRIVDIEEHETVPTNCIQVDSEDGMYLVGRELIPTHNSSIITFAGIIQEIIRDPEITIAIFAATGKIVKKFFLQIKEELETNIKLKEAHPDVFWLRPEKESSRWSSETGLLVKRRGNPKEATVEAHGLVDAMPTGSHFKLLVYDDLVTERLVTNSEMIEKVTERWELSDNLGVGAKTRKWHVGTRYDFADTYGVLIERKVLKVRLYPATENGTLTGKPVMMTQEEWARVKLTQPSTVGAQMLQNPVAGKHATFKMEHLRAFEILPATVNIYIVGDPSKGRNKDSDETAIAVIAIDALENKYLVDGYNHRMGLDERWANLKRLHQKWNNVPGVQTVKVGWEQYGLTTDIEHFETMMRIEKYHFAIEEVAWVREGPQSKEHRVQRLQPDFAQSRFYIPAVAWHEVNEGGGPCLWRVNADDNKIDYRPLANDLKSWRHMKQLGQQWRIQEAIIRKDEDGKLYDITRKFVNQYLFFPRSKLKDFIDAVSRVYDLDPVPPVLYERGINEPVYFPDA